MMMTDKYDSQSNNLKLEIEQFSHSRKTLQLATLTPEGKPTVSYSPFIFLGGSFYILVSDLAQHGQNLKYHSNVSMMLIEDELEAQNIFARKRLSLEAIAQSIVRDSEHWLNITAEMEQNLGETVALISQLSDFNLYQLNVSGGHYVKGFGKAFEVAPAMLN